MIEEGILDDEFKRKKKIIRDMLYASFPRRVAAFFIDVMVFIPIYWLSEQNMNVWKSLSIDFMLTIVIPIAYKIIMEWKYGATIGKFLMKIRVVNYKLESISLYDSIKRFSLYFFSYLSSFIFSCLVFSNPAFSELSYDSLNFFIESNSFYWPNLLIIFFINLSTCSFVLFSKNKQALHDFIAKTYCVNKNDLLNLKEVNKILNAPKEIG